MDIIVCTKQVPSPDHFSKITIDLQKETIRREGIPTVINPLDRHAIEEALKIREKLSGKITAITMGPSQAREALEEALAMGVDDAVLISDPVFAGADTLATAYTLSRVITELGHFDLVFCGNQAADGATGHVGPQLAELLDVPHVSHVKRLALMDDDSMIAIRSIEFGQLRIKVRMPALLAVVREINEYRLPTALAIAKATEIDIKTWSNKEIGVNPDSVGLEGSPTRVIGWFQLTSGRKQEILQGSAEIITKEAVKRLRELGAIK